MTTRKKASSQNASPAPVPVADAPPARRPNSPDAILLDAVGEFLRRCEAQASARQTLAACTKAVGAAQEAVERAYAIADAMAGDPAPAGLP